MAPCSAAPQLPLDVSSSVTHPMWTPCFLFFALMDV